MRVLLVELQARESGLDSLNGEQRQIFQRIANGELDEAELSELSPVNQLISQRLVIFRTVSELQERNTELLEATRNFAQRMEGEEAKAKAEQQEKELKELEQLRDRCASYEDEVKSLKTRSQSYIKERDMYRRMLTHRGQLPPADDLASQFGQSVDGRASQVGGEATHEPLQSKDIADYAKIIKDMQAHLDAMKNEADTDHAILKQQRDQLAKERGTLQSENAKFSSQLSLEHQRYELLNSTLSSMKAENAELRQRTDTLREAAAKQDLRTQQVAEDLIEAKTLADSTRNEVNNLKQLNEMLKRSENRLTEDNKTLLEERGRLNKLVSDLQTLQNERELSESENRRRLQTKSDALESELSTIKRKLDEEVEESKKAALRREYEQENSRAQIDDLQKSRQNIKEDLVAAQTSRDLLQARVEELKIELKNAEARADALQPRPSTRPDIASAEDDMNALSREQELAVEVADLKRDLELTKAEVESANVHVENYKNIAQDAEEQLASITAMSDQYSEETDALIKEKDAKISDLGKRVDEITSELASTSTELTDLQAIQAEADSKFNDQKSALEADISRLKDECERWQETANFHQEDKKTQAEIAQHAQQSYENELVKHAEATTALQKIRGEYNELRTEVASIKAEAETAKTALAQNEKTWSETKDRYEREVTNLKMRREEIDNQNKLLHQQLDNVSSQITALKQSRTNGATDNEASVASPGPGGDSVQEVIRYLRREKEIVDVQYEMSIQEQKRLRQQLEYTQTQLEQTREKLSHERQSQLDKEQNALSHTQLIDTINELNVFRESSTTLRHEARQAQKQLADKVAEVENLVSRIQPLEARVQELENELENKNDNIGLLEKLRDELQQRNQNILSKYNRIDPAEHDSLKEQVATLQTELEQAVAEKQPLQERLDGHVEEMRLALEQQLTTFNERRTKLVEQSKAHDAKRLQRITALQTEKNEVASQLEATKLELESTKTARDDALAAAEQRDTEMGEGAESGEVDETKAALEAQVAEAEARATAAETKAAEELSKSNALDASIESLRARVYELEQQINTLQHQLESSKAELTTLQECHSEGQIPDTSTELEGLQAELASIKQENEALRASVITNGGPATDEAENDERLSAEQITEQVNTIKAELEAKHADRMATLEETFKKRSENMKNQLNTKLREKNEALAQMKTEHEEAVNRLKSEHSEELSRISSEHADEVARLNSEFTNRSQVSSTVEESQPKAAPTVKAEESGSKPAPTPAMNGGANSTMSRDEVLKSLTDPEVKDLVAKNATINGIIKRNIQTKLALEKDTFTKSLNAEHEKALEAVKSEAATTIAKGDAKVKNAEMMLQKRYQIKRTRLHLQLHRAWHSLDQECSVFNQAAKRVQTRPDRTRGLPTQHQERSERRHQPSSRRYQVKGNRKAFLKILMQDEATSAEAPLVPVVASACLEEVLVVLLNKQLKSPARFRSREVAFLVEEAAFLADVDAAPEEEEELQQTSPQIQQQAATNQARP
ncbi:hypothetical protein EJ05DRAFT_136859 [Pseudovirgaria hyperparasitica]|uniref:Uncharacterized protein n=1 Tax=Pseudovirgaria hyperparasitica TaxID=470096 RepID=A0A6A6VZX9_9PEZI|nr:uncharacterized protein EJ05DRAFT_136859 [Pseudovirgaria hyperparasitica]KAF2754877.1 hypothetical protein EJ05DRAFT_136859 [Pseudovirgaria hyperparasitica]